MKAEKGEAGGVTRAPQSNWLAGRYEHALDIKSRLIVPSEWRNTMGLPLYVYIVRSPHKRCLWLMPPFEMEQRMSSIRSQSLFDERLDDAMRAFGDNSQQAMLDVQGRIRIQDRFLEYAGLVEKAGKVVMIGLGQKVEIWSSALAPKMEAWAPVTVPKAETEVRAYADEMKYLQGMGI